MKVVAVNKECVAATSHCLSTLTIFLICQCLLCIVSISLVRYIHINHDIQMPDSSRLPTRIDHDITEQYLGGKQMAAESRLPDVCLAIAGKAERLPHEDAAHDALLQEECAPHLLLLRQGRVQARCRVPLQA